MPVVDKGQGGGEKGVGVWVYDRVVDKGRGGGERGVELWVCDRVVDEGQGGGGGGVTEHKEKGNRPVEPVVCFVTR